jgi:hypothetical protein
MWMASVLLLLICASKYATASTLDLQTITPEGRAVAELLDSLHVEQNWHLQTLLASPKHDWFLNFGQEVGWKITTDLIELQYAANQGKLAIISKRSLNDSIPGHIAVVRPNPVYDTAFLLKNGPQVAQAGSTNSGNITANKGFRPFFTPNVLYAIYDPARAPFPALPATIWAAPSPLKKTTTSTPTIANTTVYAVDLAPSGRIDAIRISYSSKGLPVWAATDAGIGVSNSSAWLPWYTYSISPTGKSEPFLTRKNGWSVFGLSNTTSGSIELSVLSQQGDVGTIPPVTLKPDLSTPVQPEITGMWYAALDGQFFGLFITKSTATELAGYVLKYSDGGNVNGGSLWENLSANWTTTSTNTTGRSAVGYTEKCILSTSKVVQCSKTASNVVLEMDGNNAKISGLALPLTYNSTVPTDTVSIIQKATSYYKLS